MMTGDMVQDFLVCLDWTDSRWELPSVASSMQSCLIGWRSAPAVDAGIPEWAADLLARTMVKHALVTFPVRTGGRTRFVHASRADEARAAFNAEHFDWTQRGQVIVLSPPHSPPELSESHLHMAGDGARLKTLSNLGATGVLLPGVDGDVAGLYTFSSDLQNVLLASLKTACRDFGAGFRRVTETEFIND